MAVDKKFKEAVFKLVAKIPKGRLMTYGQVAALCGEPRAAWEVGQIAHYGPEGLPWQRVVNKQGGLARGYTWGGFEGHKAALEAEGFKVSTDYHVDLAKYIWHPPTNNKIRV